MRFPISLYMSMVGYLIGNKMRGVERFPLVLMPRTDSQVQPDLRGLRQNTGIS